MTSNDLQQYGFMYIKCNVKIAIEYIIDFLVTPGDP